MLDPVLVFDFDNTITRGDILDDLIEKYSPDSSWKVWEAAWVAGDLSARDCLRRQVGNMRVSRDALFSHLASIRIDPALPAGNSPLWVGEALRRSPELVSFLRCDTRLPDPVMQKMAEMVCASVLGQERQISPLP